MRILTLIWLAFMALSVVGTSGCFVSTAPVITPGAGTDMGAELTFLTYEPEGSAIKPTGFRLTRQADGRYELALFDPGNPDAPPEPWIQVDLLRVGSRDGAPVVLMQARLPDRMVLSDGQPYGVGIFTLRTDGVAVMAAAKCDYPAFLALSEKHGLQMSCFMQMGSPYFLTLDAAATLEQLTAMLSEGLATGVIGWEDGLGFNLFDSMEL